MRELGIECAEAEERELLLVSMRQKRRVASGLWRGASDYKIRQNR